MNDGASSSCVSRSLEARKTGVRRAKWRIRSLALSFPRTTKVPPPPRIEHALDRVLSCIAEQGWDAEVLVVDDG